MNIYKPQHNRLTVTSWIIGCTLIENNTNPQNNRYNPNSTSTQPNKTKVVFDTRMTLHSHPHPLTHHPLPGTQSHRYISAVTDQSFTKL